MTLFFNLEMLEKEAGNNLKKFLAILEAFHNKKLPSNRRGALCRKQINLVGSCYLLNPDPLFKLTNTDIIFIIQYIKLAARRDYSFYKHFGTKTLLLSYFPDLNIRNISSNPLLKITDKEIFFKFEEE